jgi:hypothetical protein
MIRLIASATATIIVVSVALFGLGGERVGAKQKDLPFNATPVFVTNDAASPVLTWDTMAAGRIPFKKWVIVHLDEADYRSEPVIKAVPKGFRFVVTDINVDACTERLKDEMAANLTIWPVGYGEADPNTPPDDQVVPKNAIVLTDRGVFRGYRHFGASQQPNVFVDEGEAVWAEVYRSTGRQHAEARVWVTGFFEPNRMLREPGY